MLCLSHYIKIMFPSGLLASAGAVHSTERIYYRHPYTIKTQQKQEIWIPKDSNDFETVFSGQQYRAGELWIALSQSRVETGVGFLVSKEEKILCLYCDVSSLLTLSPLPSLCSVRCKIWPWLFRVNWVWTVDCRPTQGIPSSRTVHCPVLNINTKNK